MDLEQTARLLRFACLVVMGAAFMVIHLNMIARIATCRLIPPYVRLTAIIPVAPPLLIGRAGYPSMARTWFLTGAVYGLLWAAPSLFRF